jgi:hypothetical protein
MRPAVLVTLSLSVASLSLGWPDQKPSTSGVEVPYTTSASALHDADVPPTGTDLNSGSHDEDHDRYEVEDEEDEDQSYDDHAPEDEEHEETDQDAESEGGLNDEEVVEKPDEPGTQSKPHPNGKIPEYRYRDEHDIRYHSGSLNYNFRPVFDHSVPIDDAPLDVNEDVVRVRLSKRRNIGGVYYCKSNGKCQYRDGELGRCYSLPEKWMGLVGSFRSDGGDSVCEICM